MQIQIIHLSWLLLLHSKHINNTPPGEITQGCHQLLVGSALVVMTFPPLPLYASLLSHSSASNATASNTPLSDGILSIRWKPTWAGSSQSLPSLTVKPASVTTGFGGENGADFLAVWSSAFSDSFDGSIFTNDGRVVIIMCDRIAMQQTKTDRRPQWRLNKKRQVVKNPWTPTVRVVRATDIFVEGNRLSGGFLWLVGCLVVVGWLPYGWLNDCHAVGRLFCWLPFRPFWLLIVFGSDDCAV